MGEKRLIVFMGSMGRGGAERVISLITNYFCEKDWKVWIVLLLNNVVGYELNNNITVVDLSGKTLSRIKRLPFWILQIRKIVKTIKPTTILSFAARINIIVQLALLGIEKRIVVSERNDPYKDGRSKLVDMFTKLLYPKANAVVFQTRRAESYFTKYNLKNTLILPNPISVTTSTKQMIPGKIVSVGRLEPQKNQKMLIRAFADIVRNFSDAELYIYGQGTLKEELQQLAQNLKVGEKVHLLGNVSNVHEQIADANLFVLSSDYEGLSNAFLEAMMMGIPCISTDCAGADEYIKNGQNGILIHIGNEKELNDSIEILLKNKEYALQLGENAKKDSYAYSKEIVLEKWYRVIIGE